MLLADGCASPVMQMSEGLPYCQRGAGYRTNSLMESDRTFSRKNILVLHFFIIYMFFVDILQYRIWATIFLFYLEEHEKTSRLTDCSTLP